MNLVTVQVCVLLIHRDGRADCFCIGAQKILGFLVGPGSYGYKPMLDIVGPSPMVFVSDQGHERYEEQRIGPTFWDLEGYPIWRTGTSVANDKEGSN